MLGQRGRGELVLELGERLIDTRSWPTIAGLHKAAFEYIEGWYNVRRHSSLGYLSPAAYEAVIHHHAARQAA